MKARQAVLEFEASPPGSDALALAEALDVEVPEPKPEAEEVPDRFPSVFEDEDPATRALKEWSLKGDGKTLRRDLDPRFAAAALAAGLEPAAEDLPALLGRAELADAPGILDQVARDLESDRNRRFGARAVHAALPLSSLLELGKRVPRVAKDPDWVCAVLRALGPGAETGLSAADSDREWLKRILAFEDTLPGGSGREWIKAAAALRLLELSRDWPDADALVAFLRLPRRYKGYMKDWALNLDEGDSGRYAAAAPVLRCADEEGVVRECMTRLLAAGADEALFRDFVKPEVFERWAVSAALLGGRPVDDARVREALDDAAFRALRDRRELAWARGTGELVFAADEPVALALDVKNVPNPRVAVYDIDPFAACAALGGEPAAGIDVGGLVPTAERTLDFSDVPPARRHAETVAVPEAAAPGVYLVEVSGESLSSRALVRKGRLRVASRTGAAGHVFTVLADDGAPLPDAELLLDGRLFRADPATARIRVPFAEKGAGGTKTAVVRAGRLAAPFTFAHEPERYDFSASFLLPPESLVAGSEATLVVHPSLVTGCGDPVSAAAVGHPVLELRTRDVDGTESVETTPLAALSDADDVVHRFRVPARLRQVRARLSGTVRNVASGTDDPVSASFFLDVGSLAETDRVETLLLVRDAEGARLELRGRTGETIPHREVALEVERADGSTGKATLQGDAEGVVRLGPLPDARTLRATCLGATYRWDVGPDEWETAPTVLAVPAGEPLDLLLPGWRGDSLPARDNAGAWISLREKLATGAPGESRVAAVRPLAGDRVRVEGLAPGDYELKPRLGGAARTIRVVAAQPKALGGAGLVASERRGFEDAASMRPPRVAGFAAKGGAARVRLADAGPDARLHVVARRTVPAARPDGGADGLRLEWPLSFLAPAGWTWPAPAGVDAVSGVRMDDEARYVLERRSLPPRIGNMLDTPSVLVSPWSPSAAPTGEVAGRGGGSFGAAADGARGQALARFKNSRGAEGALAAGNAAPAPSPDFLAEPAVVLPNLAPDADGVVEFPLAALRGAHDLALVCAEGPLLSRLDVRLPSRPIAARDLRLRSELDADATWTQRKSAAPMAAGDELPASADASTSWQAYATVGDLYRLFQAVGPLPEFAEFSFVAEWADLPRDRRLELYGSHACHELDILLAFADPDFFADVVVPRLREKRRLDFVDTWLLGGDVSAWLEPGVFEGLSLPEKALAVRASPGAKAPPPAAAALAASLARRAKDRDEANARSADLSDTLFARALGALGAPEAFAADAVGDRVLALGAARRSFNMPNPPPAPAGLAVDEEDADWAMEEDYGDDFFAADEEEPSRALAAEAVRYSAADYPRNRAADKFAGLGADLSARAAQPAFRRNAPETREWRESGWWHRMAWKKPCGTEIGDGFWADVFAAGSARTVLSPRVAEAAAPGASFAERMFALAVSGLPFKGPGVSLAEGKDGAPVFRAASPALLFRQVAERAAGDAAADPLLAVQRFFDPADPTETRDGETWEKNVPADGAFYAGRPYGLRTVLSNPTGRERTVSVLVQIPEGAMPLGGAAATRERAVRIAPYGSWKDETAFYFPLAEDKPLPVQPAGVVERGAPAGRAAPFACRVEAGPPPPDKDSWAWIARNGSPDDVLAFLRTRNLLKDADTLSRVAWRAAADKGFFEAAAAALDGRAVPDRPADLLRQAFRHGDRARIAEWMAAGDDEDDHADYRWTLDTFGPFFLSRLVARDAQDAGDFEHAEFRPLIHARAHPFGDRAPDNEYLRRYWTDLLERIAHESEPDPDDRLLAAVCLYSMDRPDDALAQLEAAARAFGADEGDLVRDWFVAYAAFCAGEPEKAEALAAAHADWPLEPWRGRWRELAAQLAEIRGAAREDAAAAAAAAAPGSAPELPRAGLDVSEPEPGVVAGTGGAGGVLRAWPVDVESLFSSKPFDAPGGGASATFVRPAWETPIPAAGDGGEWKIALPPELAARDLALEATGADGASKASLLHAPSSLRVQTSVPRGELVVRGPDGAPVPGAYVKVFARAASGGPAAFHKDGYTDLRGVFDYASVSARPNVAGLEFSVLVLRPGFGSRILRVSAP